MKVLIASVSTGAGHVRAAEALEKAFAINHPGVKTLHVNAMNYVTRQFRRLYEDGYSLLVQRAPNLWGSVYRITGRHAANKAGMAVMNRVQRSNAMAFFNCVDRFAPDAIVATHFLIPQLLSDRVRRGLFSIPIDTVITDYELHPYWIDSCVRRYFVARPRLARKLERRGIPECRIAATGIPIDPIFVRPAGRVETLASLGFWSDIPTLLVLSGGLGFGALEKTVERLFGLGGPLQMITVSGKNEMLQARLNDLRPPTGVRMVNLGYATNMHELLGVADIVITKAGGLTVSEGLARGAGLVIHPAFPGQEWKNAAWLLSKGAGMVADTRDDLFRTVSDLLLRPESLARLRANAAACAQPGAAFRIVDAVVRGAA